MGPLKGIKVIEMGGIGPGPFAGMLLADMGAEVITIERKSAKNKMRVRDCSRRGKRSIAINLKSAKGVGTLLRLVEEADVIFEGFRPGVMERLGIGPEECMKCNPKLIYGRMTGWGQTGPLSKAAGHDINYISLSGALHAIGRPNENPVPPLNLVGDYGGGAMFLVVGILAAYIEAQKSGIGQVIDAAMTDGTSLLMSMFHTLQEVGMWSQNRGSNLLDSGAFFYDTYETKDSKYVSLGSLEPKFYALLMEKANLDPELFGNYMDQSKWPTLKKKLGEVMKTKTRDEWCEIMEGTDICFAPVLDLKEAPDHHHNKARNTYIDVEGMIQPAPAPRFSKTPSEVQFGSKAPGEDSVDILKDWGFSDSEIDTLSKNGALN